jgi:hypothetical protein
MSEFQCSEGHLILPSIGYCPLCREQGLSGKIVCMDGMYRLPEDDWYEREEIFKAYRDNGMKEDDDGI